MESLMFLAMLRSLKKFYDAGKPELALELISELISDAEKFPSDFDSDE